MEPGPGAIEYARSLVTGMSRQEAAVKLREEPYGTDRRVKRCDYCRYWWRDTSLRNTKRTCSEECRTGIRTLQRSQQRADKALLDGEPRKKRTKRESFYVWWLEYPFWISEYEALKQAWKFERPYEPNKLAYMKEASLRKQKHGRKSHSTTPYWS